LTFSRGFKSLQKSNYAKKFGYAWLNWEKSNGNISTIDACKEEILTQNEVKENNFKDLAPPEKKTGSENSLSNAQVAK
jgi:hypothetical protein